MNDQQIRDRLRGEWQKTLTGLVPEDSISLDGLVSLLSEILTDKGFKRGLRPGVSITANGRYMLDGKFIRSSEAFL